MLLELIYTIALSGPPTKDGAHKTTEESFNNTGGTAAFAKNFLDSLDLAPRESLRKVSIKLQ
jgi:hypothetical protein